MPSASARILNVDDYPPGLYARSRVLKQAGFDVIEASTGLDTLRLAAAEQPDLVLLDVNLPDMDGFEVCRRIKDQPETSSILVMHLSATSVKDADRIRGLQFGADNYLVEPIEPDELIANVHALLRMRRAEQAARLAAEEAGQRRQEAETLAELARSINASLDLDTVLRQVAVSATRLCRSDDAQVALRDPSSGAMVLDYRLDAQGSRSGISRAIEPGRGVGGQVLATGRPFRTADYAADPRVGQDHLVLARQEGIVASMAVPITIGDQVEGLLYVVNRTPRAFTDRDEEILQHLADHAAIAIRNGRLYRLEQTARADAEAANRAKDDFLATVSHELRTPLAAMLGWVRLLRSGRLDEATRTRALDSIDRNARAQAQLIEDLVDVSRFITGSLRLEARPVDLVAVATTSLDAVRPAAEAKGVRLSAAPGTGDAWVTGDPDRLAQVVGNLLSNAVKFTPAGGRIDVTVAREDTEIVLRVADTGQGIGADFLPHVFERFRQADATATRWHGGLGLGLAIVRHLVELHGGRVRAESAGEGQGATFTVTLPRLTAAPRGRAASASAGGGDDAAPRLDGLHVLLVENEPDSRELLAVMLRDAGARVTTAASAREAMAALAALRPDVLVSDIAMPEEDGYALVRQVRDLPSEQGGAVPAVALSAYARADDRALSLAAGFQEHLRKPVLADQLAAAIRRVAGPASPARTHSENSGRSENGRST